VEPRAEERGEAQGGVVQVDPIKPTLKAPGTKGLKLKCCILPSTSTFKFDLRRYNKVSSKVLTIGWSNDGQYLALGQYDGSVSIRDKAGGEKVLIARDGPVWTLAWNPSREEPHDVLALGEAVQVDPIKPTLQAPGTKRLTLDDDAPLSDFAFKFNLHRYSWGAGTARCRSTSSTACRQGLTLVHFTAQRKHILWDTLGA
jgi:WD40 repeat protein